MPYIDPSAMIPDWNCTSFRQASLIFNLLEPVPAYKCFSIFHVMWYIWYFCEVLVEQNGSIFLNSAALGIAVHDSIDTIQHLYIWLVLRQEPSHNKSHKSSGWFTLLHCGWFLADPDAITITELIESNQVQLVFTIDSSTNRMFSTEVCVCMCYGKEYLDGCCERDCVRKDGMSIWYKLGQWWWGWMVMTGVRQFVRVVLSLK